MRLARPARRPSTTVLAVIFVALTLLAALAWSTGDSNGQRHIDNVEKRVDVDAKRGEPLTDFTSCLTTCTSWHRKSPDALPSVSCPQGNEPWCEHFYTPEAISEACTLLCRNQFPADCAQAKFLVVIGDMGFGYGAELHNRMLTFTYALVVNRVLVFSRYQSGWTGQRRPGDDVECQHGNPQDCYYEPITHCALPSTWQRNTANIFVFPRSRNHSLYDNITSQFAPFKYLSVSPYHSRMTPTLRLGDPRFPIPTKHLRQATTEYWYGIMARFLFRPKAWLRAQYLVPKALETFAGPFPRRFASVFIRKGDKAMETALVATQAYFDRVSRECADLRIEHVYVSSDSKTAVDDFVGLCARQAPGINVYAMRQNRTDAGFSYELLQEYLAGRAGDARDLVNVAVADAFIMQHATVWVGTLSSNQCRFHNELRCGSGRYGRPYISLDSGKWSFG